MSVFIFLVVLSLGIGTGQTRQKSASDLIQDLVHLPDTFGGTCGQRGAATEEERAVARSLVRLGVSALPDIEGAFDSIEKLGNDSVFLRGFDWLLIAYAKIIGPAAFPRIRQMRGDPNFSDSPAVDTAAAISLGLTSYVRIVGFHRFINAELLRGLRESPDIPPCSSAFAPRNALDFVIVAWERGDRALLEEGLGPNARRGLDSLLKDRTWDAVRAELWQAKLSEKVAVGYRFDVRGLWSEPITPLEDEKPASRAQHPENPELDTFFKNGEGKVCGMRRIRFLSPDLKIDNPDIEGLLRLISACAANE